MKIDLTKQLKNSSISIYQNIFFQNDTENKAIQEKDERTLFQEYLYTNEGAGAKKLINFLNEDLMVQLQD